MFKGSPIINPAGYPVEIKVLFDPATGNTELHVSNRGKIAVDLLRIAALLTHHAAQVLTGLITGKTKLEEKKAADLQSVGGGEHA